jgi:hypothetical protein
MPEEDQMKRIVIFAVVLLVTAAAGQTIGAIDTIGGTVYDCSMICAGQQRWVYYDPGYGVHVAWCWSEDMTSTTFPDRNTRYNFRSDVTGQWAWIDTNYMHSGLPLFSRRSGYGAIDVDPTTHTMVVSDHSSHSGTIHIDLVRDIVPGSGTLEYAEGSPATDGYQWPWHAISGTGTVHVFPIMANYELAYWRMSEWPDFGDGLTTGWYPPTTFPDHLVTASKRSGRVAAMWSDNVDPIASVYVRKSDDDGVSWGTTEMLPLPRAFGGDTMSSVSIWSLGALFDSDERYNVVAAIMPIIQDTGWIIPMEIWHYCEGRNPPWTQVHRAGGDRYSLLYPCGYNTGYACRPKVAQDPTTGRLCVIWSQYDSMNFEPVTELLRADVWCSTSRDGITWDPAVNLTGPDSASEMYCDIAPIVNDTMHIVYQADLQAGMWVQNQGNATRNPIIYLKVPVSAVAGVEERSTLDARHLTPGLAPNPCRSFVTLRSTEPVALFDRTGRHAAALSPGRNDVAGLAPGVYFWTTAASHGKLVVQR